jgi:hypothetical protein
LAETRYNAVQGDNNQTGILHMKCRMAEAFCVTISENLDIKLDISYKIQEQCNFDIIANNK